MPYKSQAQAGYFHTHKAELEKQGVNVDEWDAASKGKHLPKRAGMAQGGIVKAIRQEGDGHLPKGEQVHHKNMAGGGGDPDGGIGGHNDGHGIYAQGGPVLKDGNDKHFKTPDSRSKDGRYTTRSEFLDKTDRFTGGRVPLDYPAEAQTEEDWSKPRGVGTKEDDDIGDCKKLPPVLPHRTGGHYSYAKGERETTTDTFHEAHGPKQD
jgi:hypothetical protein